MAGSRPPREVSLVVLATAGHPPRRGQPSSNNEGVIRRRVVVSGHVQGVFFRDSCRDVAQRHGVSGWVRNAGDGSVEAELEGEPQAIEAVVEWARHGPDHAQVDRVTETEAEPTGQTGFSVR